MKGFRFAFRHKIIRGFLTLTIIFNGSADCSVYTIVKVNTIIRQSQHIINILANVVNKLIFLVSRSNMLINCRIHLQTIDGHKYQTGRLWNDLLKMKNKNGGEIRLVISACLKQDVINNDRYVI